MIHIVSPVGINVRWRMRKRNSLVSNEVVVHFICPKCKRTHRVRELYSGSPNWSIPHYHRNRCGSFSIKMPWFREPRPVLVVDKDMLQLEADGRALAGMRPVKVLV